MHSTSLETATVLVIDDDAIQRVLARQYLEIAGFDVIEAAAGKEGLEVFYKQHPDLVLLDVKMKGIDGFEVCAAIRKADRGGAEVPVVMVTGLEDVSSIEHAYAVGATDFVTKPVLWETLGHRVRHLIRARQAVQALVSTETRLSQAHHVARIGSWEWDIKDQALSCSPELLDLFSVPADKAPGNIEELLTLVHPEDRAQVEEVFANAIDITERMYLEFRLQGPPEIEVAVERDTKFLVGRDGQASRLMGTVQDISDRKNAERQIHDLAYYDSLTRLPNRVTFRQHAERALAKAARENHHLALLFLDLDGFKYVNDSLGHSAGDALLQTVAGYLQESLRASDIVGGTLESSRCNVSVSRLGGDEFTVLMDSLDDFNIAARVATRVLENLKKPMNIRGKEVTISGSIGISIYPDNAEDIDTLLRNADVAMYHAKREGRDTFRFYAQHMQDAVQHRLNMEQKLKKALENNAFELFYQTKTNTVTGAINGLEALLRWNDQELGTISPAEFIPIAEESGLIVPIGEWVLNEACRQSREWQDAGFHTPKIAVNLSSLQFNRGDIVSTVKAALQKYALDGSALELELTESVIMEHVEGAVSCMRKIKSMGISLALDDFGTGYSSIAYLKDMPLDVIKIDQSFVATINASHNDSVIVGAIIALAHGLQLSCVAEGVETKEQLAALAALDCDSVQGFLIDRPAPAAEVEAHLRRVPTTQNLSLETPQKQNSSELFADGS